jgi:hypothetical protein
VITTNAAGGDRGAAPQPHTRLVFQ